MKSLAIRTGGTVEWKKLVNSILLSLPAFLILWFFTTRGRIPEPDIEGMSALISILYLSILFFLMQYTGKTYSYRKLLFVSIALSFPIPFISNLIAARGSMTINAEELLSSSVPFCHLVIPMVFVPAALSKTIIFPGSLFDGHANISMMLAIWIAASIALGKGWCSWVCFYGGWDEGFSNFGGKKRMLKLDRKWTYLPYAVLIGIILTSAISLSPTYCQWLCPFKAVTEFHEVNSVTAAIQFFIFASLFIGLVMVLPILTGKRVQCTVLCPFVVFQALTNKINIFDIRIDKDKCKNCKTCIRLCPTISIQEKNLQKGKTGMTCNKCGRCVDNCPKGAVTYHIKGTGIGVNPAIARNVFLYAALVFVATMGSSMIAGAVNKILLLITTGSMI
ncbi:MAG: 4Fe-4S binding protein [Deltaproteobacteria bacterium]|nr:4Fe-4S binding protein [Deltaproteobacteria bacterium]